MKISPPSEFKNRKTGNGGFTMIEIAIAVGVIGFALVAVIGILPRGMNVQKDNRENTIISQDAPYFLNAIRNGEMRTNNSILTGYVESITVTNNGIPIPYTNPNLSPGSTNPILTNDMIIVGLLSTPEFDLRLSGQTNTVTSIVRAMTGSAIQQNGANANTAFRYQLTVEIDPWNWNWNSGVSGGSPYYIPNYLPASIDTNDYLNFLATSLHEVRLKFAWPVLPNGNIGPGRQTYRSMVSSHLSTNNYYNPLLYNLPLWFFQPQSYINTTNS